MTQQQPIHYIDYMRVIACLLVVTAHCCDPFIAQSTTNPSDFLAGAAWGSALRCCVPLFVMISGLLLLPIESSMGQFYSKRLPRVIIPLAIWSVIAPIAYYLYLNHGVTTASPSIDMAGYTAEATAAKLWSWPLNFNYDTTPLWYIYMLVGLYLFMPIISPWLRLASRKDLHIVLGLWIAAMCLPYLMLAAPTLGFTGNYGSMELLGGCLWNPYGTFYYFSGFLGYLILAFYLKTYPPQWSTRKLLTITLPLFALGYSLTFGGFLIAQKLFPGDYSALEIPWYFSGINVSMMTVSAYLLIRHFANRPSKLIGAIARLTFGVYLCHFFIVQVAYDMLYSVLDVAPALKIPLMAVVAFTVSLAVVWVLSKLPFRKYIIG